MEQAQNDINVLQIIAKEYPETNEWISHKCNWEHMTRLAVLRSYREHIENLMNDERK